MKGGVKDEETKKVLETAFGKFLGDENINKMVEILEVERKIKKDEKKLADLGQEVAKMQKEEEDKFREVLSLVKLEEKERAIEALKNFEKDFISVSTDKEKDINIKKDRLLQLKEDKCNELIKIMGNKTVDTNRTKITNLLEKIRKKAEEQIRKEELKSDLDREREKYLKEMERENVKNIAKELDLDLNKPGMENLIRGLLSGKISDEDLEKATKGMKKEEKERFKKGMKECARVAGSLGALFGAGVLIGGGLLVGGMLVAVIMAFVKELKGLFKEKGG